MWKNLGPILWYHFSRTKLTDNQLQHKLRGLSKNKAHYITSVCKFVKNSYSVNYILRSF